jgi:MFS family permease
MTNKNVTVATPDSRAETEESDFSYRKIKLSLVCLVGSLFATSLLPFGAIGLVMVPMTQEFGWSRTEFSLATTFLMWFGALTVPFLGRLCDRVGVRPVLLIGTFVVGVVTLAMSAQTQHLWQFYLYYALLGIFGSSGIAYAKVIAALFGRHRGKALAIFGVESTVAMALVPAMTNLLLINLGWRNLYLVFGSVILVLMLPLYFMVEEPGTRRVPGQAPAPVQPSSYVLEGMTAGQALKDRTFWLIVAAAIFGMAPVAGMLTHMVAAMMDKGFTQDMASWLLSLSLLFGIVGTMLGGYFVDKVQSAKVNIPFALAVGVAWLLFWIVTPAFGGVSLLLLALAFNGTAFAASRPMATYFQTRFFGIRSFGEINGIQMATLAIAMGCSPPLIGLAYDRLHSYDLVYVVTIAGSLLAAFIYFILGPYRYSAGVPQTATELTETAPSPLGEFVAAE